MKKDIKIISDYDGLSVGKYQRIAAITTDDAVERSVQVLSILTGLERDELLSLPVTAYEELIHAADFLDEPPKNTPRVSSFKSGEFDLRVADDVRKMTAGQYIDYQTMVADAADHIVELLACFLIPKGKRYMEDYDIDDVYQIIRDEMPVPVALGLLNSFLLRLGRSLRVSLTYSAMLLKRKARREKDTAKRSMMLTTAATMREAVTSMRNGGGLRALMLLASVSETVGTTC